MIVFKFDVAAALESAGVTSYTAVKNGLLSVDTWRKIKKNDANIRNFIEITRKAHGKYAENHGIFKEFIPQPLAG